MGPLQTCVQSDASKAERERRKNLVQRIVQEKREAAKAEIPLSREELFGLFNHIDEALGIKPCQHSLKLTRVYLSSRNLPEGKIILWLGQFGGFCDCEVLANVEDHWGE